MSDETTLTGCHHTENPNIYQEYVCAYCEEEKDKRIEAVEETGQGDQCKNVTDREDGKHHWISSNTRSSLLICSYCPETFDVEALEAELIDWKDCRQKLLDELEQAREDVQEWQQLVSETQTIAIDAKETARTAEAKLAAVGERARYACAEFNENWDKGRVSIDCLNAHQALKAELDEAVEEKSDE